MALGDVRPPGDAARRRAGPGAHGRAGGDGCRARAWRTFGREGCLRR